MTSLLEEKEERPASTTLLTGNGNGNITDTISQCTGKLIELNGVTEDDFLSAGKELHTILSRAKEISRIALLASELVNGKEMLKDVEDLHSVFELINAYFHQSQSQLGDSSTNLTRMTGLVDSARVPLASFKRIVKHLHMLGMSTKIENARIMSSDNSFFILAEDVEKMALVIAEKSEDIDKELSLLHKLIGTTLLKITILKDRDYEKAQSALDKIRKILSTFSEKRATSADTVRLLADRSKSVSAGISSVVSSIQFHDIVRQQIEHVVETLNDVKCVGSGENKKENTVAVLMGSIGELQIRQLENARREFLAAVNNVIEDLRDISGNVLAMSRETKALLGSAGKNGATFLAEMTSSLGSVISFSVENENTHKNLSESLNSISGTMGELSGFVGHIEEIGSEIELIALNALVKAAHSAADGAALGVIAQAIAKLSDGARSQTRLIADVLKSIRDAAVHIGSVSEREDVETGEDISELTKNAENLSNSMTQSDGKIMSLLNNLEGETRSLILAIDSIVNGISAHRRMEAVTTEVIDRLKGLVNEGRAFAAEDESQEVKEYLDNLKQRYTMNTERFIHQSHVGEIVPVTGPEITESNLGDNVELF